MVMTADAARASRARRSNSGKVFTEFAAAVPAEVAA